MKIENFIYKYTVGKRAMVFNRQARCIDKSVYKRCEKGIFEG